MSESKLSGPEPGRPYTGETTPIQRSQPGVIPRRTPVAHPGPPGAPARQQPGGVPPRTLAAPPAPPAPYHAVRRRAPYRPRRRVWPWVRKALLIALAALLMGMGLFYWHVHAIAQTIVVAETRPNPPVASPLLGGMNVLLIGVDERPDYPGEGVRSDTLILAHIDAIRRHVSLLSIPRDTQVEIPEIGITKINIAYGQGYARAAAAQNPGLTPQQGGMALTAQIVEDFLRLPERGLRVQYTAQINFDGFAGVIDALGGITIDVPRLIIDDEYPTPNFGIMRVEFQPGVQRMDGATALMYVRTRHADSDFGRSERQQQVLHAILAELRAKNMVQRMAVMSALRRVVEGQDGNVSPVLTTLPIARPDVLLGFMLLSINLDPDQINQVHISPETVAVTEIGTNLIWDSDGVWQQVDRWLTRPDERTEQATVQVFNGTEINGLAKQVSIELEQAHFRILAPENAPPGDYPYTIVYDVNHKPRTGQRVARTLRAKIQHGPPPDGIASQADIVVVLGTDKSGQ